MLLCHCFEDGEKWGHEPRNSGGPCKKQMNGVSLKPWWGAQPWWRSFNIANWNHCTLLNPISVSWWTCAVLNHQTCFLLLATATIGNSYNRQQNAKHFASFPSCTKFCTCNTWFPHSQLMRTGSWILFIYEGQSRLAEYWGSTWVCLTPEFIFLCVSVHFCVFYVCEYVCSNLSMETRGQHQLSFLSNTHHFFGKRGLFLASIHHIVETGRAVTPKMCLRFPF